MAAPRTKLCVDTLVLVVFTCPGGLHRMLAPQGGQQSPFDNDEVDDGCGDGCGGDNDDGGGCGSADGDSDGGGEGTGSGSGSGLATLSASFGQQICKNNNHHRTDQLLDEKDLWNFFARGRIFCSTQIGGADEGGH